MCKEICGDKPKVLLIGVNYNIYIIIRISDCGYLKY